MARTQAGHKPTGAHGLVGVRLRLCLWRVLLQRPLRLPPPQVDHPHHGDPGQQGKAARLGHRLFADALAPVGGEDGGVGVVDVAVVAAILGDRATPRPLRLPPPQVDHPHHGDPEPTGQGCPARGPTLRRRPRPSGRRGWRRRRRSRCRIATVHFAQDGPHGRTQAGHKPARAHGLVGIRLRWCYATRRLRFSPPQVDQIFLSHQGSLVHRPGSPG